MESLDPKPNTVLLAVASNDGNLVVAVSSNSDEWLKKKSTVDALFRCCAETFDGKHSGLVEIRNRYDGSDCGAEEDLDVVADRAVGVGA